MAARKTKRFVGRGPRNQWFWPVTLVGGAAMVLFLGLYVADYLMAAKRPQAGLWHLIFTYDAETAQNALGNLAQVVVAVLGIVITVVSIVVQLAANRYTPRITDMFFRDRTNLLVLGFFVTTSIASVWVSLAVERDFVPNLAISGILVLVTISLLLVIPYFAYVFDFLDPQRVIARIREVALMLAVAPGDKKDGEEEVAARQQAVLLRLEHLGDIAVNAVGNRDKIIAMGAVNALKDLAVGYLARKQLNAPAWFLFGGHLQQDPDIVSMEPHSAQELATRQIWLEWKLLRHLQSVFSASMDQQEVSALVAIDTRYIGEAALAAAQGEVVRLVVKFMNTDLRTALNGQRVRAAYNLLNQYRLLTERILAHGDDALCEAIGGYLRYYAQLAHQMQMGFVAETVAYDLAALCELAFVRKAGCHDVLLRCLLSVDQAAETEAQEKTLRGVRKAQIKLATGYMVRGEEHHARQIYMDMKDERPERLRSIREELEHIDSKDFWEIIDRGTNFDYLDEGRKAQLAVFFSWFERLY